MKIAFIVLKGLIGGGIEKYTEEIGTRLAAKGHEIIVYTMKNYGEKNGIYKGMKIKTVPAIKTKSFEKLSATFFATFSALFEKNIDIYHFHAFGPSMFSFIPKILGKKVVVQGHGIEWQRSRWNFIGKTFLKLTERPSVIFADRITVVSNVQVEYIMKKYGMNAVYIPTGVNQPKILKPNLIKEKYGLYGNDYILFAARLVKEKGVHYLIKAYNEMDTELKLVIAGDALYEDEYKKELQELAKSNKNIIFTGFVTGDILYELFSNCYIFVLPSELEGLPTALLEAMSYGNCCLVSDIPENIEALNDLGFTFQNKNYIDLKNKLLYLIENKDKVESVKPRAKEYVLSNFSWDQIADRFEQLYKEVLNEKD